MQPSINNTNDDKLQHSRNDTKQWIWVKSLEIGDKIDFFVDECQSRRGRRISSSWNVGVITKIHNVAQQHPQQYQQKQSPQSYLDIATGGRKRGCGGGQRKYELRSIKFLINHCGSMSKWCWITIGFPNIQNIPNLIAKLHTYTLPTTRFDNSHLKIKNNFISDKGYWLKSLKINDKLDVYCKQTDIWDIGTIINIQKKDRFSNTKYRFAIHFGQSGEAEWMDVDYVKMKKYQFAKLNEYTPYHKNVSCVCLKWVNCRDCNAKLCIKCYATTINGNVCDKCLVECEEKLIFNAIKSSNTIIIKYDDIIQLISKYSIGYILDCSHKKKGGCNNKIIIDNQLEFIINNNNKYIYYDINTEYVNINTNMDGIVELYGKYRRVSCGSCKMTHCGYNKCCNQDTGYLYCLNHPTCSLCTQQFNEYEGYKCKNCHNYVCSLCGFQSLCRLCIIQNECNDISNAIWIALEDNEFIKCFDKYIINIIAQYSTGYIIDCSNKTNKTGKPCRKILIADKFDFHVPIYPKYCYYDIDDKYIDEYDKDKHKLTKIYGAYRRFFCGFCGGKRCAKSCCKNVDVEYDICFNHAKSCSFCHFDHGFVSFVGYKCKNCPATFCAECGYQSLCKNCIPRFYHILINGMIHSIDDNEYIMKYLDMNIVHIIQGYSKDIIQCANSNCNKLIRIDNIFELGINIDHKGYKILHHVFCVNDSSQPLRMISKPIPTGYKTGIIVWKGRFSVCVREYGFYGMKYSMEYTLLNKRISQSVWDDLYIDCAVQFQPSQLDLENISIIPYYITPYGKRSRVFFSKCVKAKRYNIQYDDALKCSPYDGFYQNKKKNVNDDEYVLSCDIGAKLWSDCDVHQFIKYSPGTAYNIVMQYNQDLEMDCSSSSSFYIIYEEIHRLAYCDGDLVQILCEQALQYKEYTENQVKYHRII